MDAVTFHRLQFVQEIPTIVISRGRKSVSWIGGHLWVVAHGGSTAYDLLFSYNNLYYHLKQIFLSFHWPRAHIALAWKWQIASLPKDIHTKNKFGDRMIKQSLNSVIAKYRDLSVSRRSIICLSLRLRKIIDLLATDKSRYFAQPRPIIVNSSSSSDPADQLFSSIVSSLIVSFFSLLGRLACQCAKKARDKGYKVFGLQFYGECWSDENGLQTHQKFGKANDKKCIMDLLYKNNQYEWKYCDMASDQPCIGQDSTNYVYVLNEGSGLVKISLPVYLLSDPHISV